MRLALIAIITAVMLSGCAPLFIAGVGGVAGGYVVEHEHHWHHYRWTYEHRRS